MKKLLLCDSFDLKDFTLNIDIHNKTLRKLGRGLLNLLSKYYTF